MIEYFFIFKLQPDVLVAYYKTMLTVLKGTYIHVMKKSYSLIPGVVHNNFLLLKKSFSLLSFISNNFDLVNFKVVFRFVLHSQ